MTTKPIAAPKQDVQQKDVPKQAIPKLNQVEPAEYLAVFPEYPPRGDMNNPIYLHEPSHMRSIAIHFGRDETTLVLSEVPISPSATIRREHRRPDLVVAFNCDRDLLIRQKGYATRTQGKPPDFVLEVASSTTGIIDFTDKRIDYAAYGIPEYWRYDRTGGDYHDVALAGDVLVNGEYKRLDVRWHDGRRCSGYSEALDLYVCWEYGQLRWYDHKTGKYLMTFFEEREFRLQETERANEEAFARWRAETRAAQEAYAHQQAEAENRRLRAELEAIRHRMRSDEEN